MTREELIRNLKYTMEKHKNDTVNTFGTNISDMCKDILDYLEQEPCDKCKYFDGNSCQHYDYKVGYTQGYEDASKNFRQEPCDDDYQTDMDEAWKQAKTIGK